MAILKDTTVNGSLTVNGENAATIVESGEGYIRFGDGTQICYGLYLRNGYTNNATKVDFAKAFINTNFGFSMTPLWNSGPGTEYLTEQTTNTNTQANTRTTSSVTILRCISFSYVAIGR